MMELTISETKDFIRHVALRHRKPVMLWGQPGAGKSQCMEQLAKESDEDILIDIRLSQYDSVDLRGFPGIDKETGLTVWHAPSTLPIVGNPLYEDVTGIIWLFLDEANAAAPAVSAVAYQLVNDRRIGEHRLMKNVRIVLAGNREGDKGIVNRQPLPLSNRLVHAEVVVSVDEWCYYQQERGLLPPIALAFYQFRKELLNTFDPQKADKAFSTPRSAETAWLLWNDMSASPKIRSAAMAGAIGLGTSAEAEAFAETWELLSGILPKVRKDPESAPLPKANELGLTYAITIAIAGEMNPSNCAGFYTYLTRLDPEFVVMAWMFAQRRDKALLTTPTFMEFAKQYRQAFRV